MASILRPMVTDEPRQKVVLSREGVLWHERLCEFAFLTTPIKLTGVPPRPLAIPFRKGPR
jgi:hypothetical protein